MMKGIRYSQTALQHVHVAMEHLNVRHRHALMMDQLLPATHMEILTTSHLMGTTLISKEPVNMFSPHHVILWNLPSLLLMELIMTMYPVLIQ